MKQKINPVLWSMFAHINEGLIFDKISERDLTVSAIDHSYQPITFIDVVITNSEVFGDGTNVPKSVKKATVFPNGSVGWRYAIYNSAIENTQDGLKIIADALNQPASEQGSRVMTGIRTVLSVPYQDENGNHPGSKQKPKGYIQGYNGFVNRVHYMPSFTEINSFVETKYFTEYFDALLAGRFLAAEKTFNKIAARIPDIIKQIAWTTQNWSLKTKRQKVDELYCSLDIDLKSYKVSLGIDLAKPITDNDKPFEINRSKFNPEEWFEDLELRMWYKDYPLNEATGERHHPSFDSDELLSFKPSEEFIHLSKLMKQIGEFNIVMDKFRAVADDEVESIRDLYQAMFRANIQAPIIRSVNQVWAFSDICEEGRKLVDDQASIIIEDLVKLGEEKGFRVYLDVTNFLCHRKDESGNSVTLPNEDQVILNKFRHFMSSFGNGVQTALLRSQSPLLAPMSETRPVDLNKESDVPVIDGDALLNQENVLRK